MSVVFKIDGTVKSMEKLNDIRQYLEDEAKKEYNIVYNDVRLTNVHYYEDKDYYSFSLEFLV
jgi:hypothetical protein